MSNATEHAAPNRRRTVLGILAAGLVVALGVVLWPDTPEPTPAPAPPTEPTVVRLTGSDTIGAELAPALVESFLKSKQARDAQPGRASDGAVTWTGTPAGRDRPVRFEIRAQTTEAGFTDLAAGAADVAMASQKITPQDVEKLERAGRGDLTDAGQALAIDALAVIVSQKNTSGVTALSKDQLRGVFTCAIKDWRDVGGAPGPIRVLVREEGSGTRATFRKLALDDQQLCPEAEPFTSEALSTEVANDPSAIGFVSRSFQGTDNRALELFTDGTRRLGPTDENISRERYLLNRRLYLYLPTTPDPASPDVAPLATEFVDFALEGGQPVVTSHGFFSPYPAAKPEQTPCVADLPPRYCTITDGFTQEYYIVQFDSGGNGVDRSAARNLDRLAARLTSTAEAGRQVRLIGFTDSDGDDVKNQALSEERAESVRTYLAEHGVDQVTTEGFGKALPVAPNDTPEGKEQNRRVEVWLR